MGCGDFIEDTWDDAVGFVEEAGKSVIGQADWQKDIFDDVKKGWDDMRGATQRKEMEKQAEEQRKAAELQKSYERGRARQPRKTGGAKASAGSGGQRGTRIVREPLGTGR